VLERLEVDGEGSDPLPLSIIGIHEAFSSATALQFVLDLCFLFGKSFLLTSTSLVGLEVDVSGCGTNLGPGLDPGLVMVDILEVDAFGSDKDLGSGLGPRLGMLEVDASGSAKNLGSTSDPRLGILGILVILGILIVHEVDASGSGTDMGSGLGPRLGIRMIGWDDLINTGIDIEVDSEVAVFC
jgi:hypothetical protein